MKNLEKYLDVLKDKDICLTGVSNDGPNLQCGQDCKQCIFYGVAQGCTECFLQWLNEEYKEKENG